MARSPRGRTCGSGCVDEWSGAGLGCAGGCADGCAFSGLGCWRRLERVC